MKEQFSSHSNMIKEKRSITKSNSDTSSVLKSDNTGIEKTYISEKYDYRNEIKNRTSEVSYSRNNSARKSDNSKKESYIKRDTSYNLNLNKEGINRTSESQRKHSTNVRRLRSYDAELLTRSGENLFINSNSGVEKSTYTEYRSSHSNMLKEKRSITKSNSDTSSILKSDNTGIEKTYISEKYDHRNKIRNKTSEVNYSRNNSTRKSDNSKKDKAKLYINKDNSYNLNRNKEGTGRTPEIQKRYSDNTKNSRKSDTRFVTTGGEDVLKNNELDVKTLVYHESREQYGLSSKILNKNQNESKIKSSTNSQMLKESNNMTSKTDSRYSKEISSRSYENRRLRNGLTRYLQEGDENFGINIAKDGILKANEAGRIGLNLTRYASVGAANLFSSNKIKNANLGRSIKDFTIDKIESLNGNVSQDIGIKTVIDTKNKIFATKRFLTDRKGFTKKLIADFEMVENSDLGVQTVIKSKNAVRNTRRVVKGISQTSKMGVKGIKRTSKIAAKAGQKATYIFRSLGKALTNPIFLKAGLIIILTLSMFMIAFSIVSGVIPSATLITTYPITTSDFAKELLDSINLWDKEVNDVIDGYHNKYDDVVVNYNKMGDRLITSFQDVFSILAIETNQEMSTKSLGKAKELHEMFYEKETMIEYYVEDDVRKTRIIVDLTSYSIQEVMEKLNYDKEKFDWGERLASANLSELYPDLLITGGTSPGLTKEEIEKYGGKMVHPLNGQGIYSSVFGYRVHPISGQTKFHSGDDIAAPMGTPIYAAKEGTVIFSGVKGGYGNTVMIDHGGGVVTLYAHCSSLSVGTGTVVKKGDGIAKVGSTGYSTGPHLHFEVRINGEFVNPKDFLY